MKRLFPFAALGLLIALIYSLGGLEFVERRLLEARFGLTERPATGEVVLVAIDARSLRALNVWPWPRGYHATVIENLLGAGTRRVAFDVDFSSRSIVEEDRQLAGALAASPGHVVLPVFHQWERDAEGRFRLSVTEPLPQFRRHALLATINITPDSDGLTRRYGGVESLEPASSFAATLTGQSQAAPDRFYLDFGIDPDSVPRLSYVDVLSGAFDPELVRGKAVVIGSTAVELGDQVAVPRHAAIPGPLVQALAFESLIQGRALRRVAPAVTVAAIALLALLVGPWLSATSWRQGLLTVLWVSTAAWALSVLIQQLSPYMIEVAPLWLTLVGCYGWGLVSRVEQQKFRLLVQRKRIDRTERVMHQVVQSSFDAIVILDGDGRVHLFNRAARTMFGRDVDSTIGGDIGDLLRFPAPDAEDAVAEIAAGRLDGLHEVCGIRADGSEFPIELAVASMEVDGATRRVVILRDITERKAQQRVLEHQATHDALTGLPNRYHLRERLGCALAEARRTAQPVAFMILDLDRFKDINDTLGHHTGDRLLRSISTRLRSALRPGDTIARFGGDEFAVLLPDTEQAAAIKVARRLARALQTPFRLDSLSLQVESSVGVALYPEHGEDSAILIQRADVAMYVAKRVRLGVQVYDEDNDFTSLRQLTLSGELRGAIETDSLQLHYQPKVAAETDQIVGVEALLRWNHPRYGNVPPDEFVALAEQTGMIRDLTHLVFDRALRQCAEWNRESRPLEVSVNISARNLLDENLPATLEKKLAQFGVPPEQLTLEITEGVIMEDPQRAMQVATALRILGVNIAIDDFGIGYSSLSYLKKLPARELKIDKSFVMEMDRNLDDATIVRSTIELAHNLGLSVVAEGVEREEIWQLLKRLGCDTGQGYLFSRPLAADDLVSFLNEWRSSLSAVSRVSVSG